MTTRQLVVRYAAFASIATLCNLSMQRLVFGVLAEAEGYIFAVAAGTAVGLVVKYVLDKRWIFYDRTTGLGTHGRKFSLYTAMGVVTTLIFWGMETAFWLTWKTEFMRELGAIIGLSIGYVTKYNLDRQFVFRKSNWIGS